MDYGRVLSKVRLMFLSRTGWRCSLINSLGWVEARVSPPASCNAMSSELHDEIFLEYKCRLEPSRCTLSLSSRVPGTKQATESPRRVPLLTSSHDMICSYRPLAELHRSSSGVAAVRYIELQDDRIGLTAGLHGVWYTLSASQLHLHVWRANRAK